MWWPWIVGGGVRINGGVSRYEGNGAGSAHRDFAGVEVVVGISGGVSRCEGWCADLSRDVVVRGVWSEESVVLTMSEVVVS